MNTRRSIPVLLLGGTFLLAALAAHGETPAAPDGKALFTGTTNKCNTCHTISAAGIAKKKAEPTAEESKEKAEESKEKTEKKPPDLSSVGLERKADWIGKFLMKTETIKGEKHPRKFRGTDAELKTLATWLESQKAPKKK